LGSKEFSLKEGILYGIPVDGRKSVPDRGWKERRGELSKRRTSAAWRDFAAYGSWDAGVRRTKGKG